MELYGSEENIKRQVAASVQQASTAGFEVANFAINPADPDDSIKRLEDELRSRRWDGVLFGYGVRGNKDYNVLFEKAVNTVKGVAPAARLLFGTSPADLMATLERNF